MRGTIEDENDDGIDDRFAHILDGQLAIIQLEENADTDAAIEELRRDPEILYAERNDIVRALAIPNDPRFAELYSLDNTGQAGGSADADIDAVEVWDETVGNSDVVVGVVDTGVDYNHEDLAANVWVNLDEIPGNGEDDDGDGIIDDVHGFNALTGGGDPFDDQFHGTHCSGTIGAVGNNGIGVVGVNWRVQIMALKFLDDNGFGTTGGAIRAIDYAVAQRNAGVNLRVLSNSWGGGGFSRGLLDAITAAGDTGILFVAAAGNFADNNDAHPVFPVSYDAPNVVAVAATDQRDELAPFSNFGANSVDLGAPGVAILSTTPGNTYQFLDGTSMATPHVSGVAALLLSFNETLTVDELKDALLTSGDPIPALEGVTVSGRRLNAAAALDQVGPSMPRFALSVTQPSIVIAQDETANYAIDVESIDGFTGDVALRVDSDPTIDATVSITPLVTSPGTAMLTVATSLATATGAYTFTVTGESGELVRSRTVSLRVRAPGEPPFGVGVSPASQRVLQSDLTSFDVTVESFGFDGNLTLGSTSEPPLSADAFFDPPVLTAPGLSSLRIFPGCDTQSGDYNLTITATSDDGSTTGATVVLTVLPFGSTSTTFPSNDTPTAIPDGDPAGITSTIDVSDDRSVFELAVEVNITHPSIGDLVVQLVGPDGTAVTLHDRASGDADIHRTYALPEFRGTSPDGPWRLVVSDNAGAEVGTLDSWALSVTGPPRSFPPVADFLYFQDNLTFEFIDRSFAGGCALDAALVAWEWDFGDTTTSSEQNPIHSYAAPGDYTVSLTVTDGNGLQRSTSQVVTATSSLAPSSGKP